MAERPLYTLYKGLKANNYDVPESYDSFEKTLVEAGNGGANSRHTLYNNLKNQGYDVPDTYESFYRTLFTPVNKTTSKAIGGEVPMSDADKRRFSAGAANISYQAGQTMRNAGRYNKLKERQKKQKTDFGRVNIGTHKTPYGGDAENVVKDDFAYNPETGKAGTYVTSDSEDSYGMAEAEQKQAALDKQNQAYQEAVDAGDIPSAFDVRDKAGNYDLQENAGVERTYVNEKGQLVKSGKNDTYVTKEGLAKQLDAKLRSAYSERDRLNEMARKRMEEIDNREHQGFNDFMMMSNAASSTGGGLVGESEMANRKYENDDTYRNIMTALRQNKATITTLEDEKTNQLNGFWHTLGTTIGNGYTFTDGMGVFNDVTSLMQAKKHLDSINKKKEKGLPLSDKEKVLESVLNNTVINNVVQTMYGGDYGAWARAGATTAQSLDFMKDIMEFPGAASIAKSTASKVAGIGTKQLAKKVGENAVKAFAKKSARGFMKATGMLVGSHVAGAAISNTTGLGTTMGLVGKGMAGTVDKEKGNYVFRDAQKFIPSLIEAERNQIGENGSEMFGEFLPGGKTIVEGLGKIGLSKLANYLTAIGNKQWYKQYYELAKAGGYNGILGEGFEEYEGILYDAITGHAGDAWNQLKDRQTHIDIWLGVGAMSVLLGAIPMAIQGTQTVGYFKYKNKLNHSDNAAYMAFGSNDREKWEELRDKIDNTTNDKIPRLAASVAASRDTMSKDQIDATLNYINNLVKYRTYNIAEISNVNETADDDPDGKRKERNQQIGNAYSEGQDAEDSEKHNIQLEQQDQMATLAGLLGITEQQLSGMTDEELESMTGQNDKLDQAIYDYQLSTARYQGVVDNANDKVEAAAQQASHETDMLTDQSRGTVRNATVIGINGEEDYGVYIISGKLATHEDGAINISGSDDMILYYDPKTKKIEHADARRFVALGEELPAEEVKAQAIADAKDAAIKAEAGIIDGAVEVGTQFLTTDADGTEHTYEVLADNGDGTAMITIDGNVEQNPYSFEDLQNLKDAEDLKRLNAAKAQRGLMEEQQKKQEEEQQQTPDIDFDAITNNDGNVVMVDVLDKDGNTRYPGSQVFLVSNDGAKAKVMEMDEEGNLKPHAVDKKDIVEISTMSLDEYKQTLPSSNIEEDRGEIEVEENEPEPIGNGVFGNVYDQFKGKVKAAFDFLLKHKGGDLLGVFHRDDVGDIDLVWGDENMGLAHIIGKHVGEGKDFESVDDAINKIDEVIKNGAIIQDTANRYVINLDGFRVAIRKNFDGEDKKWIVTAVDYNRSKEEKGITTNPTSASHGASESELAALNDSEGKGNNNSAENNENNETLTLEDGTVVPMMEDGNPDFSHLTAEQTAELYDTQFGEDAEQIISGFVSDAKKALGKATNMTVKGKNFAEQKASKAEKDKAIAEAQTAYDSAKAISDAYAERQLTKEIDTHEGRMNLIQKAKNKYNRLKNKEEWKSNPFALWNETIGKVLHRLYDGLSVNVFDHEPQTVEEYVSSNIAPYSLNFEGKETSKGVAAETGLQRKDFAKSRVLAAEGKGMTVDEFVHKLWDSRPKQLENVSDQEIRNALLGLITSDMNAYDMSHVIEDNRIAQAEEELENEKAAAENVAAEEEQRKAAEEENMKQEEEAEKQAEAAAKAEEEASKAAEEEEQKKTAGNDETLDEEMADANAEYEHLAPSYNFENDENLSDDEREAMVLRDGETFEEYRNRNGVPANGTTTPLGIKVARAYIQQKYGDKLAEIDAIFGMPMKYNYDGYSMAVQMMKIVDADMDDFDAALLMRNDNVPLTSEAILGYLDGAAELIKARRDGEKLGLAAFDSEGNPVYKSIVELANWAKEQGLEVDGESAASNYDNLYLACKDGYGVTTLVPDKGDDINMVFYFPEQLKGENGEVNQERLSQMVDEFNEGRDALHSAEADIELTDGAQFYNGDTAREFRDFVDKKVEAENKPFGEQMDESELPFSVKDGKGKAKYNRAEDVKKNRVDNTQVVDDVVGKKTRKAFDRLAKMMGAKIQWQYSDKLGNGWYDEKVNEDGSVERTIYITLDSSIMEGAQFIFGHEMTHEIKGKNAEAFEELKNLIINTYGKETFDKAVDETEKKYRKAGVNYTGGRAAYEEEVVADGIGDMIRDLNLAHTLALKMSHPLLATLHEILMKIKRAFYGTEYSYSVKEVIRGIEQAYVATAKGDFASSPSGERFSLRDEEKVKRVEKLRESKPLEITGKEYKGKYELNRDSAQKYLLDNLRGEYTIKDTGETVSLAKKGAKKVTAHSMGNEAHLKSIAVIPQLIENSIFIEEQPAYKEDAKFDSYRYYVVGLKIGGEDYTARLTIGVKNGKSYYDHYLTQIEKGNLIDLINQSDSQDEGFKPTEGAPNTSDALSGGKDTKLLEILQTNRQKNDENVKYSLRQKEEPKKKGIGYKVFLLGKDGKLYPPMVANPNGAATPVGVWLDADAAPIAGESKTGRPQVKQGGKGTQGGSGMLAYRPGWHLGVIPYALQFNRKDAEGNKTLFPKNFVFAEVEYAADVDYQQEAHDAGINPSGKYQHSLAGLKHLPTDGFYMYRTNPNPETDPWVITGAMKVNRILTRAEQADLVKKAGREPQMIQEGDIVTDEAVNAINQEIANAPKFSLKVYHGSGADFTEFDFDHMGEGAGSQAFGWGGYVTSSKKIGKSYAQSGMQTRTVLVKNNGKWLEFSEGDSMFRVVDEAMYLIKSEGLRGARNFANRWKVDADSEEVRQQWAKVADLLNNHAKADFKTRYPSHLYEVDIPEDNGKNYLDWYEKVGQRVINKVAKAVEANEAIKNNLGSFTRNLPEDWDSTSRLNYAFDNMASTTKKRTGQDLYNILHSILGSDKEASKFLSSLGFTGIKYPAGTIMGGAEEGDMNYVIFKPEDMKITDHTKFSIKTYHGSQASFDHFDHSFMGSGEGAQAYGWGTYVSEVEGIARAYAKQNTEKHNNGEYRKAYDVYSKEKYNYDYFIQRVADTELDIKMFYKPSYERIKKWLDEAIEQSNAERIAQYTERLKQTKHDLDEAQHDLELFKETVNDAEKKMNEAKARLDAITKPERNLYTVEIPDDTGDNYLGWDAPVTDKQKEKVLKAYMEYVRPQVDTYRKLLQQNGYLAEDATDDEVLKQVAEKWITFGNTGQTLYYRLSHLLRNDKKASLFLKDAGFDGVKVIAQRTSGGNKQGNMNYVIFDENNAQIVNHEKFSLKNLDEVNNAFNDALENFTLENADKVTFHLGMPSEDLLAGGVENKPLKLYGSKLAKKIRKHDFEPSDLKDLPKAMQHPIAVFNNHETEGNRSVLTELKIKGDNVLVSVTIGKGQDADINIISSTHGKRKSSVTEWFKKGLATFVNKKKAQEYLHLAAPIAAASNTDELNSAAKIGNNSETAKENGEKVDSSAPKTFEEFLDSPSLKFQIKNEEQRKAAENAYNWAVENRPDKWKQYALVNMERPNQMPEYYEKKKLADEWRRFYNKDVHDDWGEQVGKPWGNYKLFDLNKPFDENVVNVKGDVPEEFDPHKADKNREEIAAIKKQLKELNEKYQALEEVRRTRMNSMLKKYMDEHLLSSENEVPDEVWMNARRTAYDEFTAEADKVIEQGQELDKKLKTLGGDVRYSLKDNDLKKAQLEIINKTNPMLDDYHSGIRKVEDIKTFQEAYDMAKADKEKYGDEQMSSYPDETDDILNDALENGEITIYSSKPIKNGAFVTPSRMQAEDYAGGGRVYKKTVPVGDVAWIDVEQGQYAKVDDTRFSIKTYHGTGAKEGDYNYVIFKESDAKIVGNTKYSLKYNQYEKDLEQWKKDNGLKEDAQRPVIPQRDPGESAVDFMGRVNEYRRQMALWATAPTYEGHLLTDGTALGEFNRELQRGSVLKRIAFQDSMLAIRKTQEAIMKEHGVDAISMAEDAYTAENRSHGKGKNELEEYNDEFLQPLRKAYKKMKDLMEGSYDNVKVYMMAKHGLERNVQMAFKKALENDFEKVEERVAAYNGYKADVARMQNDADLENGRVDFATWRQRDNAIRTKYAPSYPEYRYDKDGNIMDYSGLTALFDGAPDIEVAASDLVKNAEDKYGKETKELWDATNAATKKILRDSYKAGMMSEAVYEYVRDMYRNYIPLRGWNETQADQVWDYIGGGKGAFNQALKTANGRTSIADDPIAYIENMAESGILINNKNWVKQHLMLLAQNHPTSLLTLSKAWYVKSTDAAGNETWIPASPQITSGMTNQQVEAAIEAFEKKMETMAQNGDATQQRGHLDITYPQTNSEEREHEVRVMKDGEEYVIYVNGDPQLAQAMNNTRAHRVREIQSGKLDRACAWLGRKMAAAYTSLSPLFIPSNYFRDLTMTLASTAIREDGRYNYLLRKNMATSWNMMGLLKGYKDGSLREKVRSGNATEKEQMFYDFMMNGGETGFVSSFDVEDLKKKFKNDLKDMDRWAVNPKKVLHTIYDGIEFMNRAIENSNRFAIYMTSIQYGRSIEESVNNAKDVTLNFNRKGTGENGWQMIRNLYLFINPAVQSLQTLGALMKHHPVKFTAVTSAWLVSGAFVPFVNVGLMQLANLMAGAFGDGDDDKYKDIDKKYWQFSKWDRRNNMILWVPFTNEFVKIPLAQEFRGFYAVGDMIASKVLGGDTAKESWSEYAEDLMGQVVDMLPLDPTGYDGNIAVSLMPNAVRPLFELAFNVDFTGKPLFKDSEYNKYDPNFTKAYAGTPDWLVRVSKMVNSVGNDYPDVQQNSIDAFGDPRYNLNNPAVVDHVLSSYLGGAYTMGSQVLGVLTKALNDPKEIKMADIPLFSKFVSNPDDRPVSKKQGDEFWTMKENHDRAANTLSKLKKQAKVDGDYSLLEQFYGSEEYKQYKLDDAKVKKYQEDKKKEKAEESGEEYKAHQRTADDVYQDHATAKDDFEDVKMKQIYTKLNGFKTSYDLLVQLAPSQSDDYYQKHKVAIDAINAVNNDRQDISDLKKGFLTDGVVSYDAEDMKKIRELRAKVLEVLDKANKELIEEQNAQKK